MKEYAYMVGIAIGCIGFLTVCIVWLRKQVFGTGGAMLSFFAVVLIGLSVFTSVKFKYGEFEAEFDLLKENFQQVVEANKIVTNELKTAEASLLASKEQITSLSRILQERQLIRPEQLNQLQTGVNRIKPLNKVELDKARRLLEIKPMPVR